LNVPLSKERAVPLAKQLPHPPVHRAAPARPAKEKGVVPRETVVLPNYVIPLFAALLVVIALIVLPFALRHRPAPTQASSVNPASSTSSSNAAANPTTSTGATAQPTSKTPPSNVNVPPTNSVSAPPTAAPQPAAPRTAPATEGGSESPHPTTSQNPNISDTRGEALDQVRPEASAKVLATIHGTVRVRVKVHVDPAGNVSSTVLDNPGPSRYFADLSLKAAKQWVFTPPEVDGHSIPSDWLIQFHFTSADVQMSSERLTQ
jgi:TonB family protein